MSTAGAEALLAIVRRSLWIVLLLVLVNAVLMTAIRQSQGPAYRATAEVVLSPSDLGSMLAGFSTYVDPDLIDDTEEALANSRSLFRYVAQQDNGALGSAEDLDSATDVSKSGTTVIFSVTGDDADDVVETASAISSAYPKWRAGVTSASLDAAIAGVRAQLATRQDDAELRRQLSQLNTLKTLTAGNVLLVEPAERATKLRPRPLRDAVLGALLGLFVALVAVAIREGIDTKVRSEEEVEDLLNVPVLGTVEALPRRATLVTVGRSNHRYGDMYALLAASVASAREDGKPTIIAVTSATAAEGKTTTASNLAAALAQRDAKVVLVDLDSRRPALGRLFRIPATSPGVGEALENGVDPNGLAWKISLDGARLTAAPAGGSATRLLTTPPTAEPDGRNGDQPGGSLRVLPIGAIAKDAIVRHPDAVRRLLASLRRDAEYVIIDTPPALSVPDMTQLAGLVDFVLVVVRHGRVARRSLTAFTRLQRNWPNVGVGAVLVATPRSDDTYGY